MTSHDLAPIPGRLVTPLRQALGGDATAWPPLDPSEVRILSAHGIVPLLYHATRAPELRTEAIHAAALEPQRLSDLRRVLAALERNGAAAILLKGTPLAYSLYPAPELRPRTDTDLLVAEESLPAVRRAFATLDFREEQTSGDVHAVRQAMFTRTEGGVIHRYDVHWAVANTPLLAEILPFQEAWPRSIALPVIGPSARGLSPVDALLLACVHRAAHHYDSERLIWLVDIAYLRHALTTEEQALFWRRASEGGVVGLCARSVALAGGWIPSSDAGPEAWLDREQLERNEATGVFLRPGLTRGGAMAADFRALSWSARLARVRQLAFPPRAFMEQEFGPHSAAVWPWLYGWRALRGVGRLFRRAR